MPALSDSAKRILSVVAAIPRGQLLGYGEVAAAAGLPGRARLVAWALRQAPAEAGLPWHRVLRSDRSIAFPADSDGYREQAARLAAEGVTLVKGRVVGVARGRDQTTSADLDRVLWGPVD